MARGILVLFLFICGVSAQNLVVKNAGRKVELNLVYSHLLVPYPSKIVQNQPQLVKYSGNAYPFLPYEVVSAKTVVTLSSNNIESYTKVKPVSVTDTSITYGPYENLPAFSEEEITVHYENNAPFLTVASLKRWIEISHWGGNIAVEEDVDVLHTGARLKGAFSRHEYQRGQSGPSSVASYRTFLPAAASSIYYRDDIGNISTSRTKILEDTVEVELTPRFPLFGGWKTKYKIGYNVPSYEYLYSRGDNFILQMRFIDHIFDEMVVDSAEVSVLLPEGAEDVEIVFPEYPGIEKKADSIFKTYLDTTGRKVITATKKNIVENHIQDFQVKYRLPSWRLIFEPLLIVVACYLMFLVIVIYVRLDFSISKDEAVEARMKAAGVLENVLSTQEKRDAIYTSLDAAIHTLKSSKDVNGFQSALKNINADHKNLAQSLGDQVSRLRSLGVPDLADKILDLQKLDKTLKDIVGQQVSLAERLVGNKIAKGNYVTEDATLGKKREELLERIHSIIGSL
ncbi:unnamed protein product [Notodromas monacha]|uniref:Dolichyl-diphosphooligosaccharide--protein glycosyltransferase subunit 1 n=1 Tax=Notodromas monacha TaxID=399045 RepID=A0A7R9BH09_9CRUS|nr:unnamed protein product [Notodromas monacha]CAG0914485.1 unnamed protein product [Notodromas monacha]